METKDDPRPANPAAPGQSRPVAAQDTPAAPSEPPQSEASDASLGRELLFGLSLPERALRSGVSLLGGAVRESAERLIPRPIQDSKTYSILFKQMLDYLVEDVGGVAKPEGTPEGATGGNDFLARKAVGNFLEMTWLATLHVSPLTMLAVVSDVAYGSQVYLQELGEELKQQGVIAPDSTILNLDDLLGALSQASSSAATAFDTPPLSVDGLRETIETTRAAVGRIEPGKLVPQAELQRLWTDMRDLASREQVSLTEISSVMMLQTLGQVTNLGRGALSTVRVTTTLIDRHVLDHYRTAAQELRRDGLHATLAKTAAPYIDAVWQNFSTQKSTVTENLLSGRLAKDAWQQLRGWWQSPSPKGQVRPGDTPPESRDASAPIE